MPVDTRTSLIESAEHLIRARGYSAFSYADLEKRIGIRKASIHYHFPTKEDLGVSVVETYIAELAAQLEAIEADWPGALARLAAFAEMFKESRSAETLPLCGALAAEMTILPDSMQALTAKYFETHLQWIEKTIAGGVANGEIPATRDARQKALEILSLLEGASLVSWGLMRQADIESAAIGRILGKELAK
ncbi:MULTISPECIES: TetR/AcrR family transcriptional regulator [Mycobacteriaceae]|uniref:TetR/AcrR family transcriptional regulator n=1 Tax=Mycobacteriaceae TaxID=1762 RepID=UPI0009A7884E|nr:MULTISPECIES: TetR/AcrR family transcriptional regulator [Mycobacteriaceae]QZH61228.1 TetR/AcrR family transcriptional regulator [Mycolicibacterium farcinogenes]SKQ79756.1 TetR family transcriptional regulator [Mycobacteroides abscessus subsp. massiliense]